MRISCVKGDAGFGAYKKSRVDGKKVKVLLNGEEVKECVTADEEHGYILRNLLDEHGNAYLDLTGEKVAQTEEYGKVEIVLEDHDAASRPDSD